MIVYLIKSSLCLLVLLSFYKLVLEGQKAHNFKRFYLLGSVLFSILIPLITISYTTDIPSSEYAVQTSHAVNSTGTLQFQGNDISGNFISKTLPYIFLVIYLAGVLVFGFRFFKSLNEMCKRIQHNEKKSFQSYIIVFLKSKLNPHTFLSYIFLNKDQYEKSQISNEILLHEKAHVDQKHSIDILLMEIIQIFFWINPLIIWLKKSVKLNHEFLADQQVINETRDAEQYSDVLFNYVGGNHHVSLSSSINYSLTKKRIIMISKSFSTRNLLARLGILIPVLGCCIFLFNNDVVAKRALKTVHTPEVFNNNPVMIKSDIQATEHNENVSVFLQERKLTIRVSGDKVWVNEKAVKPEDFAKHIDKITKNWSEEDLSDASLHIKTENQDNAFMERLNEEFSKTRLSKVSGREILPPPPPMPPSPADAPTPAAAEREAHERIRADRAEMRENLREERIAQRESMMEEREQLMAEREEMIELRSKYRQEDLSEEERKEIEAELKAKKAEMGEKRREMERKHVEMERAHIRSEREHMRKMKMHKERIHPEPPRPPKAPSAPDPLESINALEDEGGSFFHNGNKISAEKARNLVRSKNYSKIEINQTGDSRGRLEIMD